MMKKNLLNMVVLLCLSFVLAACGSDTNEISYTGDFLSWTGGYDNAHFFTLVRVNGQTGTITTIGGSNFFTGLAYGPDGTLYGVSNDLHIINPADGTTSKIGDLTLQGTTTAILMKEAAFAPDGRLFVVENEVYPRIFTVNLATGGLTLVGTVDQTTLASGIEFSADGMLYAAFAELFTLNSSDASTISTLGSTGGVYINDLSLGHNGRMYGKDIYPSTHIYSLDLDTGAAQTVTAVTSTGLNSLVAERSTTEPSASSVQNIAIKAPTASFRDVNSLIEMENEIKKRYLQSK